MIPRVGDNNVFNFFTMTEVVADSLTSRFDRTWKRFVAWCGFAPGLEVLDDPRWQGNKLRYEKGKKAFTV